MKIQINFGDIDGSEALSAETTRCVESALEPFASRVTRVEVHLRDDKQNRRGPDDHRCMMEVRLAGEQPFAVESAGGDIYEAVRDAGAKLRRAVQRRLEKREAT